MLVLGGLVVSGTTGSAVADDLRANCCTDLKEQAPEPAPDLSIPLPSANYLGRKSYDEPSGVEGFFDTWASIARAAKLHSRTGSPHSRPSLRGLNRSFVMMSSLSTTAVPTSKWMTAAKVLSSSLR